MTTARTTLRCFSLAALVTLAACAPIDDDGDVDTSVHELTGAARRPRLQRIRDVAAAAGLTNGALLGGIAQVETGLSHCWSEATWACRGPNSTSCGGGPVIAGASDGPCSAQQGGLGMFQFDGGTYAQTLARDGRDILTLDGNIRHAVDFVVAIVIREVSGVNTRAQALAWMNGISIVRGNARFDQWVAILACRYNGACGSAAQAGRYRDATLQVYSEVGAAFWRVCTPSREVCNGDDDDCNGRVDDGIAPVSCGVGACRRTVSCTGGRMATCAAGRPGVEQCNGVDDDCNGRVDDGIAPVSCGVGACRRTVSCTGGRMAACVPAMAATEVCGNGADDDCDGATDEGCASDAGAPAPDGGSPADDAGAGPSDGSTPDDVDPPDASTPPDDAAPTDDVAEAPADAETANDAATEPDGAAPTDTVVPADGVGCNAGPSRTAGGHGAGALAALALVGHAASRRRRATTRRSAR